MEMKGVPKIESGFHFFTIRQDDVTLLEKIQYLFHRC
jgi:hypothetical protein